MRHPKTIEEVTMGEIAWGAVKGFLFGLLAMAPFLLLIVTYQEPIMAFVDRLYQ